MRRKTAALAIFRKVREHDGKTDMRRVPDIKASVNTPSLQKYGEIVLENGFTQYPRTIEDYLNTVSLCPSAKLLIIILISYLREFEQEVFPRVRTLAGRLGLQERRTRQLTRLLVDSGIITKIERYAERGQLSNGYSLAPLLRKVAAFKDPQVEAERDLPFTPVDQLEEAAIALEEEYGEQPALARIEREHAERLRVRWAAIQGTGADWEAFSELVIKAGEFTDKRRTEPTRTGRIFTRLVPYFFSSLDWLLRTYNAPPPATERATTATAAAMQSAPTGHLGQAQPAQGIDLLEQRRKQRQQEEANGERRINAPERLARKIEDLGQQFHDSAIKSSIRRAANMMHDARIGIDSMLGIIQDAREDALKHQIKKRNGREINRMPYFFAILEEKIASIMQINVY